MALKIEWARYGEGSRRTGYFCVPERAATPLSAVIVFQEALGVNEHIEDVTRRFAKAGYAALAPDLYAPEGERLPALTRERVEEVMSFLNSLPPTSWTDAKAREDALAARPYEERERLRESFGAVMGSVTNLASFVPAMLDATRWLREECAATRGQRIGSVGFCMGGGLSALLACHDPKLAAAVIFYGRSPDAELATRITCPVVGFYGSEDRGVNETVPPFAEAMRKADKRFEQHTYPGVHHAFFNDNRPSYDASASRAAFARTLALFEAELT